MRLSGISFLLTFMLWFSAHGQVKEEIDSLTVLLGKSIHDTTRIQANLRLAHIYLKQKNISGADDLVNECFSLVDKSSLDAPADLYWTRADIFFNKRDMQAALDDMDIVTDMLSTKGDNESMAKAQNFIGMIYHYWGQFSQSK